MTSLFPGPTRRAARPAAAGPGRRPAPPAGRSGSSEVPEPPLPVLAAGVTGAGWAGGLGLLAVTVIVLVGWATASDSGAAAGEAVRTAGQVWLVGHGAALDVPGGRFSLLPLGLLALPVTLLVLAGSRAARAAGVDSLRGAVAVTAAVAGPYALGAAMLALLCATPAVRPLPVDAFLSAGIVAGAAGAAGATRGAGLWPELARRLPALARVALPSGAAALAVLLAGGAAAAALSFAVHHDRATDMFEALDPGAVGGVLLLVTCLLYVPTAAVWAASYAAGAGFAVGSGTSVAPWAVEVGPAPAFPLLAASPDGGGPRLGWALLLVPVAAGLLAALVAERRGRAGVLESWLSAVGAGAASGAVAGAGFAVLVMAASGAAGPGRLADTGPPWWSPLLVALEVAAVAATALLTRRALVSR